MPALLDSLDRCTPDDVRQFVIKRQWLVDVFISKEDFANLKIRNLQFTKKELDHWTAFIGGYKWGRR
jgi:hypothetical protein